MEQQITTTSTAAAAASVGSSFHIISSDPVDIEMIQINNQLAIYGLPQLSQALTGHSNVEPSVVETVMDCIRALLTQRRQDLVFRDETSEILRRNRCDADTLERKLRRSEEARERVERDMAILKLKTQSTEQEYQRNMGRLQSDMTKMSKQADQAQQQIQQLTHKLLRKEKELERFTERIAKLVGEKEGSSRASAGASSGAAAALVMPKMQTLNADCFSHLKDSLHRVVATSVSRDLSDAYESKLQEYRDEVTKLQKAIYFFHTELIAMVSRYSAIPTEFTEVSPSLFELPFFLSSESIHEYFHSIIDCLEASLSVEYPPNCNNTTVNDERSTTFTTVQQQALQYSDENNTQ
jgi:hypothetical protein